jgi:hypothetical protein
MKRLVVVLVMLVATHAHAKRVVHIPTLRELCPGGGEWSKVAECIRRHGTVKVVRDDAQVKIVALAEGGRLNGVYLYSLTKQWTLRGELPNYQPQDVFGFARVRFGNHVGYRLDVGVSSPTTFSADGETTAASAVFRQTVAMLCFDDAPTCIETMVSCDFLVHGKAYSSFRGTLVYANKQLKVVGDARNAGPYCKHDELVLAD